MGEVFRAFDERLGRYVALKHIRPDRADDPKARERFLREARVAARLSHPSLVSVHDILELGSAYWVVMELVEGETLAQWIQSGPVPYATAHSLALEIASGLAAIHEAGILHRDLKSENIMVVESEDVASGAWPAHAGSGPPADLDAFSVGSAPPIRAWSARILDFGLAKATDQDGSFSATSAALGTPRTMSPEHALGQPIGVRSDLFALGILLYEMFSGHSPFLAPSDLETLGRVCYHDPDPLSARMPELPRPLSQLVAWLLEKEPERRPSSAREAESSLRALPSVLPVDR